MQVNLAYGRATVPIQLPDDRTTVLQPAHATGIDDESAAIRAALDRPTASAPLRDRIQPGDTICVLFTDITRATPNERLIPCLLDYLGKAGVAREQIFLLNQLGTHRANTRDELEQMLTPEVVRNYTVLNHEPENERELTSVGTTRDGSPALLNRRCLNASLRIVTGFIEPHFFAGFSGGPKGMAPGVAGLRTVMSNHGSRNLGDPNATFGVTRGNPLWEELLDIALRAGPAFLLNVALNNERRITGVFAGDLAQAHQLGCEYVRASAMRPCEAPFDLVVTTNSGYPLDLNLYQGVKGMTAGARILKPGGTLIMACECSQGVPAGSSYDRLLREAASPEELLALLASPGFSRPEQWQVQIQALVQRQARVLLHSSIADDAVRAAHLEPCRDLSGAVQTWLGAAPQDARIAVLPQGPLTIPYLDRVGGEG